MDAGTGSWSGDVRISVSYKSISRKGSSIKCQLGLNRQSWSLLCSPYSYYFRHHNMQTDLPVKPTNRIGVFVDDTEGILSFYSISDDTMSLIYTDETASTEPLYPGFWVGSGSSVKLY